MYSSDCGDCNVVVINCSDFNTVDLKIFAAKIVCSADLEMKLLCKINFCDFIILSTAQACAKFFRSHGKR